MTNKRVLFGFMTVLLGSGLAVAHAQSSASAPASSAAATTSTASTPAAPGAASSAATTPAATTPASTSGSAAATTPAATTPAATAPASGTDATTPAATTPAPTAEPAAPTVQVKHVHNPYGLGALWNSGDAIDRVVLIILLLMSAASWYVMITKAFVQARMFRDAKAVDRSFWNAGSVRSAEAEMKKGTAFHYVAHAGIDSLDNHSGLLDHVNLPDYATSSIDDSVNAVQSQLQGGLSLLATVGSTAPFVGLFGTVWGIYHALTAIGLAGQASIGKVAGPVGSALIMTALGLAVAVPAVFGYNILVRRNKVGMDRVRKFAKKMLFVLLTSDASQQKG